MASRWTLEELRRRAVVGLAAALDPDPTHGAHVARLAVAIFDGTKPLHALGSLDRVFLESASLLHDVGASVSRSKHHHHSRYLILHAALAGFDREEAKWIATIARFHTGRAPKLSHTELAEFEPRDRRRILQMSAMLRIADALDHSHRGRIVAVRYVQGPQGPTLEVASRDEDPALELWAAKQKATLWRRCFGSTLRFQVRRFGLAAGRDSSPGATPGRALDASSRTARSTPLLRITHRA
jgi:exopolyphosphatase/guanosine-5'-triphosphate,3'-diphosphate pyrophosphatase